MYDYNKLYKTAHYKINPRDSLIIICIEANLGIDNEGYEENIFIVFINHWDENREDFNRLFLQQKIAKLKANE